MSAKRRRYHTGSEQPLLASLKLVTGENRITGEVHEITPDITHLHAHFLHTPASVARYAALLRGLKWGLSAHAKDIWTSARWEKSDKLANCAWAVTCTRTNFEHLSALAPKDRVRLSYHGLGLTRFPAPPQTLQPLETRSEPDGSAAVDPVVILSIGRAVVATEISAIPELITPEKNGLLVAPGDIAGATQALTHLIADPALRHRLGTTGRELEHGKFSLEPCIESLAARFGLKPLVPKPVP